jgi:hypothetical protein
MIQGFGARGTTEHSLESTGGPLIASVPVSNTGGWQGCGSRTVSV